MSSSTHDIITNIMLFGGGLALILCGIYIAKPNFHGVKFEEGNCTITSTQQNEIYRDDLPRCSCGKNCNEEYPCLGVYGTFQSDNSNSSLQIGTFYEDYSALKAKCFYIPDCSSKYRTNAGRVYSYWYRKIARKVVDRRYPYLWGYNITHVNYTDSATFSCWGYENHMYFDHSYSSLKAILALAIPGGTMVMGFILTLGTSSQNKEFVFGIVGLPFMLIAGILVAICEVVGCEDAWKRLKSCCRQSESRSRRASPALSQVLASGISIQMASQRRRSIELDLRTRSRASSVSSLNSIILQRRRSLTLEDQETSVRLHFSDLLSDPSPNAYPISIMATESDPSPNHYPTSIIATAPPPSYHSTSDSTGVMPPPPSYDDVMRDS